VSLPPFTAFFLIGPIFVPFVGEAILLFGSWRTVFLVGVLLAAVAFLWTLRFGETMAVEHRRPIRLLPFAEAFSSVLRTPVTLWALVGSTLFTATFFVWLGSSQPILDEVDDRDSRFTVFFGLSGAGMAAALLLNDQLIDRFGTRPMLRSAPGIHVLVTVGVLAVVVVADGVPSVWLWFSWVVVSNAMTLVIGPTSSALAMEPMAAKAGTASAILGLSQLGIGSVLAAAIDSRVGCTVTPMVVGGLVFGAAGTAHSSARRASDRSGQPIWSGISALRRVTKSSSSASTASSRAGASYVASAVFHAVFARSAADIAPSSVHCSKLALSAIAER
jgi:DHA1 family bicyclomycin/chloramphenicol resistance-like MFS transporter